MSAYHRERKPSLISKAAGLAALGGIIGFGLTKGARPLGEITEAAVSSNLGQKLLSGLSDISTVMTSNSKRLSEEFFSAEANIWLEGSQAIRRGVATTLSAEHRTNTIINNLRNRATDLAAFDSSSFQKELRGMVGLLATAEDPSQLSSGMKSFDSIKHLNKVSGRHGVRFDFENLAQQHEFIMESVREVGPVSTTRKEIDAYLSREDVADQVLNALRQSRRNFGDKAQALFKRFTPDTRQILFRDLWEGTASSPNKINKDIQEQVLKQLQKDMRIDNVEARQLLSAHMENTQKALKDVFAGNESHFNAAWDDFLSSATGFGITKNQKVVNWHRVQHTAENLLESALNNVQIPLVPYHFNVPLKSLRIAPKIRDLTKGLGLVSENPEIRRMLSQSWSGAEGYAESTRLISIGDQLLSLNSQGAQHIPGRFVLYDTRRSSNMKRVAESRSLDVNSLLHGIDQFRPDSGLSKFQRIAYNLSPKFAEAVYHSGQGGMIMRAKNPLLAPLVQHIWGQGVTDPRKIHPELLAQAVERTTQSLINDPEGHLAVLSSLIKETGQGLVDSSGVIKQQAQGQGVTRLPSFGGKTSGQSIRGALYNIMANADNPETVIHELFRPLGEHQNRALVDLTTEVKHQVSPQLYQALMSSKTGYRELVDQGRGEGGMIHHFLTHTRGERGITPMTERLQRGLLSQTLADLGAERFGGYDDLGEHILGLWNASSEGAKFDELVASSKFARELRDKLGIDSLERIQSVMNRLVYNSGPNQELTAHFGHIGEISSLLLEKNSVLGLSDNNMVRAKILNQLRVSLESYQGTVISPQAKNLYLRDMMIGETGAEEWLTDTVRQRFHLMRPFHPEDLGANPLINPGHYAVPLNPQYTPSHFVDNPLDYLYGMVEQGGGLGHFLAAQIDPQKAYGVGATFHHLLSAIPQSVAENVGLGLHSSDQITPLRNMFGWWAKRVLPVYVGIEMYKNINANAHQLGLPGIDDVGANALANLNRMTAGVKDYLGLTSINQELVDKLPGLDQYFTPRSKEEYEDYLFYGEEEVREGRGWLTGSRDNLMGGRITHVRPNFYRRWKSHWTEASNVDISNSEFSWLPNLMHPFAPLNRLLNPNWFVNKHLSDRPYRAGGMTGMAEEEGNYLQSNAQYGDGGFIARAGVGGMYPSTMTTDWSYNVGLGGGPPVSQGSGGFGGYGSGGYGPGGSEKVRIQLHKDMARDAVDPVFSVMDWSVSKIQDVRSHSGLVGAFMKKIPGFPDERGIRRQNWKSAVSNDRLLFGGEWGELSGSWGEFMRRLIHPDYVNPNDYNNLPNNQPTWMPSKFRRGDPYLRTPGGEFNVPGEAYESLNPWIAPLKVRGSALGGSVDEIIQKWLYPTEPLEGSSAENIVGFGSLVHKMVQRQLSAAGVLVGAEVSLYDEEHNISGTVDAVIRGQSGAMEVWDIKTQGASHWGETPEKYIDQITAYMAIMGIQQGGLAFVQREDPTKVRFETFQFDPGRWERILGRIEQAREKVNTMVANGEISPFETYDLLARIDVLSKVAPESSEFRELVEYAEGGGGFGGFEKQMYHRALKRAEKLRNSYKLYPNRHIATETRKIQVQGFTDEGDIITEYGIMALAGVEWDPQAFSMEDPEQVYGKYGVNVGDKLSMTMIRGQFDMDTMADMSVKVQIGHLNRQLTNSVYASADMEDDHPLSSEVSGRSGGMIAGLWEHLVHLDSMVTNKFMRVRTAVEQMERGEVYGTDDFRWSHIYSSLMVPTIHSITSKDPIVAAFQGGVVGAVFLRTQKARSKGAIAGAAVGFGLSTIRALYELSSGRTWKPKRVREQEEFDTYWDTIEYVKYATMAEAAKKRAAEEEGVDLNSLESQDAREFVSLGPWGALAIHAERRAKQTMYGFDELKGSLKDAIMTLPRRHRQLAESVVETGSIEEKRRFYDLLSTSERRVMGRYLGVDESSLPERPSIAEYFRSHYLPDAKWGGWSENVDTDDLRIRAAQSEGMKVERPNRNRVERAKAYTGDIRVPKSKAKTPARIKSTINRLMNKGNFSTVRADYVIRPSSKNVINLKFQLQHDQTDELILQARKDMYGG